MFIGRLQLYVCFYNNQFIKYALGLCVSGVCVQLWLCDPAVYMMIWWIYSQLGIFKLSNMSFGLCVIDVCKQLSLCALTVYAMINIDLMGVQNVCVIFGRVPMYIYLYNSGVITYVLGLCVSDVCMRLWLCDPAVYMMSSWVIEIMESYDVKYALGLCVSGICVQQVDLVALRWDLEGLFPAVCVDV